MSGDDGLRSAIRTALILCPSTNGPGCTHTHELGEFADAILALPELAALRAKAAAVNRVEAALSFTPWHVNATQMRRYIRAALDGDDPS